MSRRGWRWGALLLALPLGVLVGRWLDEAPSEANAAPAVDAREATAPLAAPAPVASAAPPRAAPEIVERVVPVSASSAEPRNVVASDYHPRPPEEWQGMLVNLALQATCETSAGCGLAMACRDGRCGPCLADADCEGGEACVLDHCVPQAQAQCRRRADCGSDELCVLSGYSSDPRSNAGLRAYCLSERGGDDERATR